MIEIRPMGGPEMVLQYHITMLHYASTPARLFGAYNRFIAHLWIWGHFKTNFTGKD